MHSTLSFCARPAGHARHGAERRAASPTKQQRGGVLTRRLSSAHVTGTAGVYGAVLDNDATGFVAGLETRRQLQEQHTPQLPTDHPPSSAFYPPTAQRLQTPRRMDIAPQFTPFAALRSTCASQLQQQSRTSLPDIPRIPAADLHPQPPQRPVVHGARQRQRQGDGVLRTRPHDAAAPRVVLPAPSPPQMYSSAMSLSTSVPPVNMLGVPAVAPVVIQTYVDVVEDALPCEHAPTATPTPPASLPPASEAPGSRRQSQESSAGSSVSYASTLSPAGRGRRRRRGGPGFGKNSIARSLASHRDSHSTGSCGRSRSPSPPPQEDTRAAGSRTLRPRSGRWQKGGARATFDDSSDAVHAQHFLAMQHRRSTVDAARVLQRVGLTADGDNVLAPTADTERMLWEQELAAVAGRAADIDLSLMDRTDPLLDLPPSPSHESPPSTPTADDQYSVGTSTVPSPATSPRHARLNAMARTLQSVKNVVRLRREGARLGKTLRELAAGHKPTLPVEWNYTDPLCDWQIAYARVAVPDAALADVVAGAADVAAAFALHVVVRDRPPGSPTGEGPRVVYLRRRLDAGERRGSPRNSPRSSPRSSPRNSPRRRSLRDVAGAAPPLRGRELRLSVAVSDASAGGTTRRERAVKFACAGASHLSPEESPSHASASADGGGAAAGYELEMKGAGCVIEDAVAAVVALIRTSLRNKAGTRPRHREGAPLATLGDVHRDSLDTEDDVEGTSPPVAAADGDAALPACTAEGAPDSNERLPETAPPAPNPAAGALTKLSTEILAYISLKLRAEKEERERRARAHLARRESNLKTSLSLKEFLELDHEPGRDDASDSTDADDDPMSDTSTPLAASLAHHQGGRGRTTPPPHLTVLPAQHADSPHAANPSLQSPRGTGDGDGDHATTTAASEQDTEQRELHSPGLESMYEGMRVGEESMRWLRESSDVDTDANDDARAGTAATADTRTQSDGGGGGEPAGAGEEEHERTLADAAEQISQANRKTLQGLGLEHMATMALGSMGVSPLGGPMQNSLCVASSDGSSDTTDEGSTRKKPKRRSKKAGAKGKSLMKATSRKVLTTVQSRGVLTATKAPSAQQQAPADAKAPKAKVKKATSTKAPAVKSTKKAGVDAHAASQTGNHRSRDRDGAPSAAASTGGGVDHVAHGGTPPAVAAASSVGEERAREQRTVDLLKAEAPPVAEQAKDKPPARDLPGKAAVADAAEPGAPVVPSPAARPPPQRRQPRPAPPPPRPRRELRSPLKEYVPVHKRVVVDEEKWRRRHEPRVTPPLVREEWQRAIDSTDTLPPQAVCNPYEVEVRHLILPHPDPEERSLMLEAILGVFGEVHAVHRRAPTAAPEVQLWEDAVHRADNAPLLAAMPQPDIITAVYVTKAAAASAVQHLHGVAVGPRLPILHVRYAMEYKHMGARGAPPDAHDGLDADSAPRGHLAGWTTSTVAPDEVDNGPGVDAIDRCSATPPPEHIEPAGAELQAASSAVNDTPSVHESSSGHDSLTASHHGESASGTPATVGKLPSFAAMSRSSVGGPVFPVSPTTGPDGGLMWSMVGTPLPAVLQGSVDADSSDTASTPAEERPESDGGGDAHGQSTKSASAAGSERGGRAGADESCVVVSPALLPSPMRRPAPAGEDAPVPEPKSVGWSHDVVDPAAAPPIPHPPADGSFLPLLAAPPAPPLHAPRKPKWRPGMMAGVGPVHTSWGIVENALLTLCGDADIATGPPAKPAPTMDDHMNTYRARMLRSARVQALAGQFVNGMADVHARKAAAALPAGERPARAPPLRQRDVLLRSAADVMPSMRRFVHGTTWVGRSPTGEVVPCALQATSPPDRRRGRRKKRAPCVPPLMDALHCESEDEHMRNEHFAKALLHAATDDAPRACPAPTTAEWVRVGESQPLPAGMGTAVALDPALNNMRL